MKHTLFDSAVNKYDETFGPANETLLFSTDMFDTDDRNLVYYVEINESGEYIIKDMGVLMILPIFANMKMIPELYKPIKKLLSLQSSDGPPVYVQDYQLFVPQQFITDLITETTEKTTDVGVDDLERIKVQSVAEYDENKYIGIGFGVLPFAEYTNGYVSIDMSDITDLSEETYLVSDCSYWPVIRQSTETESEILEYHSNEGTLIEKELQLPEEVITKHNRLASSRYSESSLNSSLTINFVVNNFDMPKFFQDQPKYTSQPVTGYLDITEVSKFMMEYPSLNISKLIPLAEQIAYVELQESKYTEIGLRQMLSLVEKTDSSVETAPMKDTVRVSVESPEDYEQISGFKLYDIVRQDSGKLFVDIQPQVTDTVVRTELPTLQ